MPLSNGRISTTYVVDDILASTEDIRNFLFTLGCYPGEKVTIISKLASNYVINIKDARYSIDEELANLILV